MTEETLNVHITGEADKLTKTLTDAENKLRSFEKSVQGMLTSITNLFKATDSSFNATGQTMLKFGNNLDIVNRKLTEIGNNPAIKQLQALQGKDINVRLTQTSAGGSGAAVLGAGALIAGASRQSMPKAPSTPVVNNNPVIKAESEKLGTVTIQAESAAAGFRKLVIEMENYRRQMANLNTLMDMYKAKIATTTELQARLNANTAQNASLNAKVETSLVGLRNKLATVTQEYDRVAAKMNGPVKAAADKLLTTFFKLKDGAVGSVKKMQEEINKIYNKSVSDVNKWATDVVNASKKMSEGIDKSTKSAGEKLKSGVSGMWNTLKALALMFGAAQLGSLIKDSLNAAMAAIESDQLFNVAMKSMGQAAMDFSKTIEEELGVSDVAIRRTTALLYQVAQGLDFDNATSLKMGEGFSKLAYDMASFYNAKPEDVANALEQALVGNTRGLRAYGIVLTDATIKQYAYRNGIAAEGEELSIAQKSLAIYNLTLERTKNAQGDLARTIDSPTNQLRLLGESFMKLKVAIGNAFMPILTLVLPVLERMVQGMIRAMGVMGAFFAMLMPGKKNAAAVKESTTGVYNQISANTALNASNSAVANSTAKAAAAAKKAAAAAKGSLVGIDEINVLTKATVAAADALPTAGVNGAGGNFDAPIYEPPKIPEVQVPETWKNIANKAKEMVDNIKQWWKGLDFGPLKASFENLKQAIMPIIDTIGKAIGWLITNILKPLAEFTITTAIPNILNAIAEALVKAQPFIDTVGEGLGWFLKEILLPLAQWVGGELVPAFIRLLGDAMAFIDPILQGFITAAKDLWTYFLEPIAAVVGWAIIGLLDLLGAGLKIVGDWMSEHQGVVDAITLAIGSFAVAWGLVTLAVGAWNLICVIATAVTTAFATVVAFLTSPIGLVVLALGAIILVTVLIRKHWDEIGPFFAKIWDGIVDVFKGIGEWFGKVFDEAWKAIKEAWSGVGKWFEDLWTGIKTTFSKVDLWFKEMFAKAWKAITDVWNVVVKWFKDVWDGIVKIFSVVATWFSDQFQKAWDGIKKIWSVVVQWFQDLWDGIVKVFSKVVTFYAEQFQKAWDGIKKIWDVVVKWFQDVWDGIVKVFSKVVSFYAGIFSDAWTAIKKAWDAVGTFFSGVWTTITDVFKTVAKWFGDKFGEAWTAIKGVFAPVGTFFGGIWDIIKEKFTKIGSVIGDAIGGAFKLVVNSIIWFAENSINGFIKAINLALKLINMIPGVNIGMINTLEIPRLARGGVVDSGQIYQAGEAGREVIMPLENNTGWINELAAKLNGGNQGNDRPLIVELVMDGTKLGRTVIKSINSLQKREGKVLINI